MDDTTFSLQRLLYDLQKLAFIVNNQDANGLWRLHYCHDGYHPRYFGPAAGKLQ